MNRIAIVIHWFRRDLRLDDNTALLEAMQQGNLPVLPLFIFDNQILHSLADKQDPRVTFIYRQVYKLYQQLAQANKAMYVVVGEPLHIWQQLLQSFDIKAVFANRDYEPYAQQRDQAVYQLLAAHQIPFKGYKDHVVFDKKEVVKPSNGQPYTVFTPYSKRWLDCYEQHPPTIGNEIMPADLRWLSRAAMPPSLLQTMPDWKDINFQENTNIIFPSAVIDINTLQNYNLQRNFPALPKATSHLGIHFRFGTISIRKMAHLADQYSATWLNELIWRDFYQQILYHFPHVATRAFKPAYDRIEWLNQFDQFERWCEGQTGYPIVDAGMRQLNQTGYMHNRVRMITASFLSKHLLIDWRWGEAYFAQKLLDFDLAANNGGWQWAASSGCDAAPYFRIFNPTLQQQKFDPQNTYVQQWLPEYGTNYYPKPIVIHEQARHRAINTYKKYLINL